MLFWGNFHGFLADLFVGQELRFLSASVPARNGKLVSRLIKSDGEIRGPEPDLPD